LLDWNGENPELPTAEPQQAALMDQWTADGVKDAAARPVFSDALLEIKRPEGPPPWTLLLERDRTRRVDKNDDRFRRYDRYLTPWHHHSDFARPGGRQTRPLVALDFDHQELGPVMAAAGLAPRRSTFVIWEGVLPYVCGGQGQRDLLHLRAQRTARRDARVSALRSVDPVGACRR